MGLRTAHGDDANRLLVVETLPADELPLGEPGSVVAEAGSERTAKGQWVKGSRTAQSRGGLAKKGKSQLGSRLGLSKLPAGNEFARYRKSAASFRRAQCAELARTVGGGECGPGPSSIVASASLSLAWSRYLSDEAARTKDGALAVQAMSLADKSRTQLLTAHELCAREAEARARGRKVDAQVDLRARLLADAPSEAGP